MTVVTDSSPTGAAGAPALSIRDLRKTYDNGVEALKGVSLDVTPGDFYALLGPNGAGKSTCINMLSGDLPPSEGTIEFMGRDITGLSAAQRSRVGIGRSYQRTNIFPQFTVLENVRLAAQSRNQQPWRIFSKAMQQKWALDKARQCIEEAGLSLSSPETAAYEWGEARHVIGDPEPAWLATERDQEIADALAELACQQLHLWSAWAAHGDEVERAVRAALSEA